MRRQHNRDNLTTKIKGGKNSAKKPGSGIGGFKKSTSYPVTPKKEKS